MIMQVEWHRSNSVAETYLDDFRSKASFPQLMEQVDSGKSSTHDEHIKRLFGLNFRPVDAIWCLVPIQLGVVFGGLM